MRSATVPFDEPRETRAPPKAEASRADIWLALLLFAATFLAYQPAWNGAAVFDDHDHLIPPELQSLEGLGRIWTEPGVVLQYYPVFHTAFWLQCKLWGHAMPGYHLVNIALHALCALLLVRILRRLEIPGAWLAAGAFALHPVMVESVAWVSEQKNTLSGAFYLGAVLAYLRFDQTRARAPYFVALALFAAGLLSKSVVASLPAALLVIFWWKRGRLSWRSDARPLLPFFFAALLMGVFTIWMEKTFIGATGDVFALSFAQRCLIAGRAAWFYLGKVLWPADLIFIYTRWNVDPSVAWQWMLPLAALLLLVATWRLRSRWRGPLAALLFFAGTLSPALGFVNVYPFRYSFVADHYQYLAALGPIVLAAACVTAFFRDSHRAACGAILLAILATLTWRQSALYRDEPTLWLATAARNPASFVAHANLGNLYLQEGRLEEAVRSSERALELRPDFVDARTNLGTALRHLGRTTESMIHFRNALDIDPGFAAAHYNLALALQDSGGTDEALFHFQEAARLRPRFAMARNHLGDLLLRRGRIYEALAQFEAARELAPLDANIHNNLGNALRQAGRLEDAANAYRKALEIQPKQGGIHYNLAVLETQKGDLAEAIRHYEKAVETRPTLAEAHGNLGLLLLKKGRTDEAARHCEIAIGLRPDFPEARYNLARCLIKTGRLDRAVTELKILLRIHPDITEARDLLERIRIAGNNNEAR